MPHSLPSPQTAGWFTNGLRALLAFVLAAASMEGRAQSPPGITVSPATLQFPSSGGTAQVQIEFNPAGTPGYSSNASWLPVPSVIIQVVRNTWTLTVTVGPNAGPTRTGVITISRSRTVTVTQLGLGILTPTITRQPSHKAVNWGNFAEFSVEASGAMPLEFQWLKNGVALPGATGMRLWFPNAQFEDAGDYTVVVSNSTASVTSEVARLTVLPSTPARSGIRIAIEPSVPVIGQPLKISLIGTGGGSPPLTYQWQKNGTAIADGPRVTGATASTLSIASIQASDSGAYAALIRNSAGTARTEDLLLVAKMPARLTNVSIRGFAGAGDQSLILGFVVAGSTGKKMLLRGIGPTLGELGVGGVVADPQLAMFAGGVEVARNDDWGGSTSLSNEFASLGAFPLPAASRDSALLLPSLAPGAHMAQIATATGDGVAMIEIYDADTGWPSSRLVNVAARNLVGTGSNIVIAGITISGDLAKPLLIRAVGPTLGQFGVSGVLENPRLQLFQGPRLILENDDWGGREDLTADFAQAGAFSLPSSSKDAALRVTLQPGSYTAQISGAGNTVGVALLEIYELP